MNRQNYLKSIRDKRAELVAEIDGDWAKSRRTEYLTNQIKYLMKDISEVYNDYHNMKIQDIGIVYRLIRLKLSHVKDKERTVHRYMQELRDISEDRPLDISQSDIEKARDVPIDHLLDSVKGFALCPIHDDHKPSMYIKNGFGYCFTCNEVVDSIRLLMVRNHLTFKEAVGRLV